MGEVYLATHPRLPRNDALKVLAPHYSGNDEFRQRFSREADIASGLDHPSIVKIYDRGEADDRLWISMQYVPGVDAHDLLVAEGPMPLDAVVAISAAVGSALDHAHGHGMIHRDVKPRNILIDTTANPRRVMLADFGIARPTDETHGLTATNLTIGTMNYTSPEQISESHIDGRADQYSLACTVYELLTGAPPFVGKGVANIIHLQLNAPPPDVRQQRPDLPAGVADAIARALQKDPGRRFGSCAEFAGALVASRQPAPAVRRPAGPSSSGSVPAPTGGADSGGAAMGPQSTPQSISGPQRAASSAMPSGPTMGGTPGSGPSFAPTMSGPLAGGVGNGTAGTRPPSAPFRDAEPGQQNPAARIAGARSSGEVHAPTQARPLLPAARRTHTRRNVLIGAVIVAVVAAVVVALVLRSTGSDDAAPADQPAAELTDQAITFAKQESATYNGTVNDYGTVYTLRDFTVTAAGDAAGTVETAGHTVEFRELDDKMFGKSNEAYWREEFTAVSEYWPLDYAAMARGWVRLGPDQFLNLGKILAPEAIASQMIWGTRPEPQHNPNAEPGARVEPASTQTVERDGDVYTAGEAEFTIDGNRVTKIGGRLSALAPALVDLTVSTSHSPDEVYSTFRTEQPQMLRTPAPWLRLPSGRQSDSFLVTQSCAGTCQLDYALYADFPGTTERGSVTNHIVTRIEVNGRPVGTRCDEWRSVLFNTAVRYRCTVSGLPTTGRRNWRHDWTQYMFTEFDPRTYATMINANLAASNAVARVDWVASDPYALSVARHYNSSISAKASNLMIAIGAARFDGRAPDGVLVSTFSGYDPKVTSAGTFTLSWPGTGEMVQRAQTQIRATSDPIRWVFDGKRAADAAVALLRSEGITGIQVVHVPA